MDRETEKPYWLAAVIAVCVWGVPVYAQPRIEWSRSYTERDHGRARCVRQTEDGGYIVVGATDFHDARYYSDVWLIKTDSEGNQSWSQTYRGPDSDEGWWVEQTRDGGYITAGSSAYNMSLIRTDPEGDKLWARTYDGTRIGFCVRQTRDGGFIVLGTRVNGKLSRWLLIKTDSEGNRLWSRTCGSRPFAVGYCVQQTADGGYVISGTRKVTRHSHALLLKTDSQGNELWSRTYGKHKGMARSVQQTKDGGYMVVGYICLLAPRNADVYLVKTDSLGDTLWTRTYGGTDSDHGESVQQTKDRGYIIAGWTEPRQGWDTDLLVIKTDALGDTVWTKTFRGESRDKGYCVQQTTDGGYIIAGYTSLHDRHSEAWLIKLAAE